MAASAQLKTQTQTQNPKTKRRKRRETTISTSAASPNPSDLTHSHRKRLPATVVSSESAWCCSTTTSAPAKPSPASQQQQQKRRTTADVPAQTLAPETKEPQEAEPLSVIFTVSSPSPSPFTIRVSPGRVSSPLMDSSSPPVTGGGGGGGGGFTPFPPRYNNFNNALTAGLLNPNSPPPPQLDKTRPNPTLFDMMANEPDYHPRSPIPAIPRSPIPAIPNPPSVTVGKPPASEQDRQLLLQERAAEIFGNCSPGNQFNDPTSSDLKLTLSSKDGLSLTVNVHRQILIGHSRFFASKLPERSSRQQKPFPHVLEISDCEDVGIYVETLQLMYCKDLRKKIMREDVSKVLSILKVSATIEFDAGISSCLEYLEAAPWAEDEEEKISTLLSQLHLDNAGAVEVLKRVSVEAPVIQQSFSNEETLSRLLQVVLQGKDEKARRDMKGLVSKMLRENSSQNELSMETLYSACNGCLQLLRSNFHLVAEKSDIGEVGQIARQADNLHWMLDILIDRQIADEFLKTWAEEVELVEEHSKVPAVHRYEVSRVTARLFVGIGKGQILVSKEARCALLRRWLEPFYEDFGWMRRFWKGLDRHLIEEGLSNTILTLPIECQQELLMGWFDRFLNSGEDCPNLQRAFEVWWRRAFWRRNGEAERHRQIRVIAAACEN